MSDLLALYIELERAEDTGGVPTDQRILNALTELRRDGIGYPFTPVQIAFLADCEPDDVTALAASMGDRWPLGDDGYPRVRQAVFAFGESRRRRRRRDAAQSVVELRRFRRAFTTAKGWV